LLLLLLLLLLLVYLLLFKVPLLLADDVGWGLRMEGMMGRVLLGVVGWWLLGMMGWRLLGTVLRGVAGRSHSRVRTHSRVRAHSRVSAHSRVRPRIYLHLLHPVDCSSFLLELLCHDSCSLLLLLRKGSCSGHVGSSHCCWVITWYTTGDGVLVGLWDSAGRPVGVAWALEGRRGPTPHPLPRPVRALGPLGPIRAGTGRNAWTPLGDVVLAPLGDVSSMCSVVRWIALLG